MRAELAPESPLESNPSKRLADVVKGYIPVIYGSSIHEGVAYRYSTQFNENGKSPAWAGIFPEAFHNSVMAAEAEPGLLERLCVVIIHDPAESPEMAAKIGRFREIVGRRFGRVVDVHARGRGRLARILSALYIGDFASAYLGILYGRDPSTTGSIDALKRC
jgi:glucose/mannose-6-phosphate isomerase